MTASRHSAFMKGGGGLQTAVAPLRRSGAALVFAMFAVATLVSLALALPAAAREITAGEAGKAASVWVMRNRSPMGETMGSSNVAEVRTPPNEAGNASNYVCGCVALAGAQIAKYWTFPTKSRPKVTRTCYVSGSSVSKTSMGGTYAWSSMPNSFSGMTTAQMQAVGKLCYDFGVATYMNWASGGSGTGGYCLDDAFRTVFGYANSRTQVQDGGAFSADIVKRAVLANLDAKCPVSLGIDGHQVVADGYGYSSGVVEADVAMPTSWASGFLRVVPKE